MNVQESVLDRYSAGAKSVQATLCCPINYDSRLLEILPQEIVDKDYGCGDPSRYVREGDVVLDLGSGAGKICYMAAQLVGESGHVIGIDMNDDMLALARKYQADMAAKLGGNRVRFVKGYIQDLALSVDALDHYLKDHPVRNSHDMARVESWKQRQRHEEPLIKSDSVDLVISNCVLNLVGDHEKEQLLREIFRVLKPGGRVAISDIVSDEPVPQHLKDDPELWSGCISGAFHESGFAQAFRDAGFQCISYDKWDEKPWQVVEGIEFRSVTLTAVKGDPAECLDYGHAVIYRGPFVSVTDDEGHVFYRGERMAVCERTFRFVTEGPLKNDFIGIAPSKRGEPRPWCAPEGTRRPASETKGGLVSGVCGSTSCC